MTKNKMEAKITVCMDNAAFDNAPGYELARILRELADKIDQGANYAPVMDVNGNKVGEFNIRGELIK